MLIASPLNKSASMPIKSAIRFAIIFIKYALLYTAKNAERQKLVASTL